MLLTGATAIKELRLAKLLGQDGSK